MASALVERYGDRISGVLSCYDRVLVTGTLPTVCYAKGMTRFLYARQIRIFDYPEFAMALRERVREAAASLAAEAGVAIEHVANSHVRKEAVVAKVLERRGDHPGLVHVISAMEACAAYKPWHDKQTHKTYLRPDSGKCLHYYFYFMSAFRSCASDCNETPSWMPNWAWSICGFPPGRHSACNSTATATAGWPGNWRRKASASPPPTTPLSGSTTGTARKNWLTGSHPTRFTV
jgi:hypothetical protein